jgi:hypothetical protein
MYDKFDHIADTNDVGEDFYFWGKANSQWEWQLPQSVKCKEVCICTTDATLRV